MSALQRCPYYRGRECTIFSISGTKRTVRNRGVRIIEVSVRSGSTVFKHEKNSVVKYIEVKRK